eukprot:6175814-Pleurochrysis_carterae.AAC.7
MHDTHSARLARCACVVKRDLSFIGKSELVEAATVKSASLQMMGTRETPACSSRGVVVTGCTTTGDHAKNTQLLVLNSQKRAYVPVIARNADKTKLKCPKFVPARPRAATSLVLAVTCR